MILIRLELDGWLRFMNRDDNYDKKSRYLWEMPEGKNFLRERMSRLDVLQFLFDGGGCNDRHAWRHMVLDWTMHFKLSGPKQKNFLFISLCLSILSLPTMIHLALDLHAR